MPNFKEHSKTLWSLKNLNIYPGDPEIMIGCMQRMADSLERMENPYLQMLNDTVFYKRRYQEVCEDNKRIARRVAALQGVITRMKNKL